MNHSIKYYKDNQKHLCTVSEREIQIINHYAILCGDSRKYPETISATAAQIFAHIRHVDFAKIRINYPTPCSETVPEIINGLTDVGMIMAPSKRLPYLRPGLG